MEELFIKGSTAKINKPLHKVCLMILDHLEAIHDLEDCLGVRGFHPLKGERSGTYAMKVTANYRITFKWDGQNIYDIDLEDYH